MKHSYIIMIFLILICGITFAIPTDEQIRQSAAVLEVPYDELKAFVQSYQARNAPSGSIALSAEVLCSEYLTNELSADSKYKGKVILLTGKVEEVKNNYRGYYACLEGASRNYIPYTIDVYFKNSELNKLANVRPGQVIKVLGLCSGEKGMFSFILTDAIFSN